MRYLNEANRLTAQRLDDQMQPDVDDLVPTGYSTNPFPQDCSSRSFDLDCDCSDPMCPVHGGAIPGAPDRPLPDAIEGDSSLRGGGL